MSSASVRFKHIDVWRAIAVSLVVAAHLSKNKQLASAMSASSFLDFGSYGSVGVFIFFWISGFVVSNACLKEVERTGTFNIRGFYIRRIFRIMRPLMVYLVTCLGLGFAGVIQFPVREFLGAAMYLGNCSQQFFPLSWYAGHTWSLAFEEQFYLLFPSFFVYLQLGKKIPLATVLAISLAAIPFIMPISWIGRSGFIVIYLLFAGGYLCAKWQRQLNVVAAKYPVTIFLLGFAATFLPVSAIDLLLFNKYYKIVYVISIPSMILSSTMLANALGGIFRSELLSYLGKISYSV